MIQIFISTTLICIAYILMRKVFTVIFVNKEDLNKIINNEVSASIKKIIDHRMNSFMFEVQSFVEHTIKTKTDELANQNIELAKKLNFISDQLHDIKTNITK